ERSDDEVDPRQLGDRQRLEKERIPSRLEHSVSSQHRGQRNERHECGVSLGWFDTKKAHATSTHEQLREGPSAHTCVTDPRADNVPPLCNEWTMHNAKW